MTLPAQAILDTSSFVSLRTPLRPIFACMRLLWLFLALAVIVLITFAVWGDAFEKQFTVEGSLQWLQRMGSWAWLAAIGLLASDLFLPIPSTVIFTALGLLYGPLWGGIVGTAGFSLGGLIAYGICRAFGERTSRWLLGERDFARGHALFETSGGWIVVISRWLPVLPEVISCIAGLTQMPFAKFLLALFCGSTPIAFTFAALGHAGRDQPGLALGVSAVVAPILWLVFGKWMNHRRESNAKE